MKISHSLFTVTDWPSVPVTEYPGETGTAFWRTIAIGEMRVRVVDYSAGYLADHWCDRGHILYVLDGELTVELKDGRDFLLVPGTGFQVSDYGDAAHKVSTAKGAKVFIVD